MGPTSKGRGKGEGKEGCLTSAGGGIKAPVRQHHTLERGALMRPIVTLSPIGERRIVMSASVCLSAAIISSELHARCSLNFFLHVSYGRGSVFLRQRSDMLRISAFEEDVTFAHKLIGCSTSPPG